MALKALHLGVKLSGGKSSLPSVTSNSFVGQRRTNIQAKSDLKCSFDTAKFVLNQFKSSFPWRIGEQRRFIAVISVRACKCVAVSIERRLDF